MPIVLRPGSHIQSSDITPLAKFGIFYGLMAYRIGYISPMQHKVTTTKILLIASALLLPIMLRVAWKPAPPLSIQKPQLPGNTTVIENSGNNRLISLASSAWGQTSVLFVMYNGGRVIWRSERSPTRFCIGQLSAQEQKQLIDSLKKVDWGKKYTVSKIFDGPTDTLTFAGNSSSVYGGIGEGANWSLLSNDPRTREGVDTVPTAFLQIYNRLSHFEHAAKNRGFLLSYTWNYHKLVRSIKICQRYLKGYPRLNQAMSQREYRRVQSRILSSYCPTLRKR